MEDFKKAWLELELEDAQKSFLIHLAIYIAGNIFLALVNLYFSPEYIWFIYPLGGWGIGIVTHFVFTRRRFVTSMWEAKVARIEYRMRRLSKEG